MPGIAPIGRYAFGQFPSYVVTIAFYFDTEIICVHREDRDILVAAEDRAMIVAGESCDMELLFEERSMNAGPKKRTC